MALLCFFMKFSPEKAIFTHLKVTALWPQAKQESRNCRSPVSYAAPDDDAEIPAMITEREKKLSRKTGKHIVLVAFDV